jgi:PST family polysaccharide transporter
MEGGVSSVASVLSVILMARFIAPEDFGLFALSVGIVLTSNTAVELLLQDAVVQRQDLTREHEESAFTLSLAMGLGGYLLCVAAAWPLARLFGEPRFVPVFLATALMLPLSGLGTVSIARLRRNFRFQPITISYAVGRLSGAILGPVLAILGAGVWALVTQHLLFIIVYAGTAMALEPPRYRLRIVRARLNELSVVALPRLAIGLARDGQIRLFTIILGVLLDVRSVGFVGMAVRLIDALLALFHERFYKISLSLYAMYQDDQERLRAAYADAVRMFFVIIVPILAGIVAVAPAAVPVVLGETWLPIIPMVQVLGVITLCHVAIYNTDALFVALGRPITAAKFFVLSLAAMVVVILAIRPGAPIVAMVVWYAPPLLLAPLWFRILKDLTGWSARDIVRPILGSLLCGALMAAVVWWCGSLLAGMLQPVGLLAIQIAIGGFVYAGLSAALNRPALVLIWRSVRPLSA